ncbi:hypothetical protein HYH02_014399 [Chlamydomonas schloesseri]|uniref:SnoaL-like domain-containing protein n=1 Tax=Chlamydomonas schloesseri TaxID=2026947 RepID=A0A835VWF8_9CHLO|nr:hypothetical protein HYH02_014399 [Chlamydomonas schloesseri]|eukprot:KAG2428383.1 hypothetical protein HYH02_014399 [Chlamydomonas schloesseri]
MLQLVSDDCHHVDLSHEAEGHCKEDVARFYADVVASMPEKVQVVVDDITGGDDCRAGVMWHMEVDGVEVPCSRGLSFYRVEPAARTITYVRQSPEHFVKAGGVVLSATASATPLIDTLGPLALPNFWSNLARGASNMLASAPPVEEMLRTLAAAGAANTVPQVMGAGVHVSSMMPQQQQQGPSVPGGQQAPVGGQQATPRAFTSSGAGFGAPPRPPPAPTSAAASVATSVTAAAAAVADAGLAAATAGARASPVVCAAAVVVDAPTVTTTNTNGFNGKHNGASLAAAATAASAAAAAANRSSSAGASSATQPIKMIRLGPLVDVDVTATTTVTTTTTTTTATAASPAMSAASVMDSQLDAVAPQVAATEQQQQQQQPAAPAALAVDPACLTGIWEKDLEASDVGGYEKALDLWQISGVQKATARLIEGLELVHSGGGGGGGGGRTAAAPSLNVHFLTIIPYFKVTEVYPMSGARSKMRRRDQRGGDAMACAERVPLGVVCRASWGAPYAGELEESYTIPDPVGAPDCMHVTSTIRVGDKSATTLQVYQRRRNMSAAQLISASEKRNGKAHDVLKRFGM